MPFARVRVRARRARRPTRIATDSVRRDRIGGSSSTPHRCVRSYASMDMPPADKGVVFSGDGVSVSAAEFGARISELAADGAIVRRTSICLQAGRLRLPQLKRFSDRVSAL